MTRNFLSAAVLVSGVIALATPVLAAAGDPERGKAVFQRCATCHSLAADDNGIGPSLHGIFGTKAGAVPNYHFSKAMADSGIVWDDATLKKFLTDPAGTIPGTKMSVGAVSDPGALDDLIAYLRQAVR